jgi:hypothetical protein
MTTTTQTPNPPEPNTAFLTRLLMLNQLDRALFEGSTQSDWKNAACTFFAAARLAKLQPVDFKFLLKSL